jgi:hypothetical protein
VIASHGVQACAWPLGCAQNAGHGERVSCVGLRWSGMLLSLLALAVTPRPSPAGSPGTFALTVMASVAAVVAALAVLATVWYAREIGHG